jgi:hypothetical protein
MKVSLRNSRFRILLEPTVLVVEILRCKIINDYTGMLQVIYQEMQGLI